MLWCELTFRRNLRDEELTIISAVPLAENAAIPATPKRRANHSILPKITQSWESLAAQLGRCVRGGRLCPTRLGLPVPGREGATA